MKKYNANTLQALSDVEAVRSHPGMYIGDLDSFGLWICLKEIIDNAVDEARENGSTVVVNRSGPLTFSVYDDGRGMPTDKNLKTGMTGVEMIFCKLHAGAKMSSANRGYSRATTGVHGVGACVTNAFAKWVTVKVYVKGKGWQTAAFVDGKPSKASVKVDDICVKRKGTQVSFELDVTRFEEGSAITDDRCVNYLSMLSKLYPKLRLTFKTESGSQEFYEKYSYAENLTREAGIPKRKVFDFSAPNLKVSFGLENDPTGEGFTSYVCGSHTSNGGSHMTGFQNAVAKALETIYTKPYDVEAFCLALRGVLNVEIMAPKFKGQTKTALYSREPLAFIPKLLASPLRAFFEANKSSLKPYLTRASQIYAINRKAENDRNLAKNVKDPRGKTVYPASLTAVHCKPEQREIYIVEGHSAGGTAVVARDKRYHEVMLLTGKLLNVQRREEKAVDNTVVKDLIRALGITPEDKEYKNGRVAKGGRIVILSDADADGPLVGSTSIPCVINGEKVTTRLDNVFNAYAAGGHVQVYGLDREKNVVLRDVTGVLSDMTHTTIKITLVNGLELRVTPKHRQPVIYTDMFPDWHRGLNFRTADTVLKGHLVVTTRPGGVTYSIVDTVTRESTYERVFCLEVDAPDSERAFFVGDSIENAALTGNCHIRNLLIGFLDKYAPGAFDQGMVHYVNIPAFNYSEPGKDPIYATSLEGIKAKVPNINRLYLHRFKGWGGVSAARLNALAFDPKTRQQIMIKPINNRDRETFNGILADTNPIMRKTFIEHLRTDATGRPVNVSQQASRSYRRGQQSLITAIALRIKTKGRPTRKTIFDRSILTLLRRKKVFKRA